MQTRDLTILPLHDLEEPGPAGGICVGTPRTALQAAANVLPHGESP